MTYETIIPGKFLARPNRFIAHVETAAGLQVCHVKNTGRCRELLVPGATVYLEESANPSRKTKYDLVAVEKGRLLINMDSQAPNRVAEEYLPQLFPGLTSYRRERSWGSSRFDFYVEAAGERWFMEVKGVTLEEDGVALFPDAPTQRGSNTCGSWSAAKRRASGPVCCSSSRWRASAISPPTAAPIQSSPKPWRRPPPRACG